MTAFVMEFHDRAIKSVPRSVEAECNGNYTYKSLTVNSVLIPAQPGLGCGLDADEIGDYAEKLCRYYAAKFVRDYAELCPKSGIMLKLCQNMLITHRSASRPALAPRHTDLHTKHVHLHAKHTLCLMSVHAY